MVEYTVTLQSVHDNDPVGWLFTNLILCMEKTTYSSSYSATILSETVQLTQVDGNW